MRASQVIGLGLSGLAVPVLLVGLLDPLEGSLAFVVGGALLLFAYATSRIQVPALAWVGWLVAVVAGAAAVGGAVWTQTGGLDQEAVRGGAPAWVLVLLAVYEAAVVVTAAGAVQYAVRLARSVRATAPRGRP